MATSAFAIVGQARAGYEGVAADTQTARCGRHRCQLRAAGAYANPTTALQLRALPGSRCSEKGHTGGAEGRKGECQWGRPALQSEKQTQKSMPSAVPSGLHLKSQMKSSQCSGQGHLMGNAPWGASDSQTYSTSHVHNHLCKEEGNLQALIRKIELLCFPPDHLIFFIQFLKTQLLKEIK